jgi:hypothetical protein
VQDCIASTCLLVALPPATGRRLNTLSTLAWSTNQSPARLLSLSPSDHAHNPSQNSPLPHQPVFGGLLLLDGSTLIRDKERCLSRTSWSGLSPSSALSIYIIPAHLCLALILGRGWIRRTAAENSACTEKEPPASTSWEPTSQTSPKAASSNPQDSRLPFIGLQPYLRGPLLGTKTPSIREKVRALPQPGLTSKVKRSEEALEPRQRLL